MKIADTLEKIMNIVTTNGGKLLAGYNRDQLTFGAKLAPIQEEAGKISLLIWLDGCYHVSPI